MRTDFDAAIDLVLKHEGGFVNDPRDPGGATNMGITHATLRAFRDGPVTAEDVKALSVDEAKDIYFASYWVPSGGGELPKGLDYAVFDFAVHSGPARAVKALQKIVGVTPDGVVGVKTLAAVADRDTAGLIRALYAERLRFLQSLSTWKHFGRGWTRRLVEGEQAALALHKDETVIEPSVTSGRADPADVRASKIPEAVSGAIAAVGAVLTGAAEQIEPYIGLHWSVQWVFIGLTFGGIGFGVWKAIQRARGRV